MAKPSDLPKWATDVGTTLEPTEPEKEAGWPEGYKPPARWQNWWQNLVYIWITWLNSILGEDTTNDAWVILNRTANTTSRLQFNGATADAAGATVADIRGWGTSQLASHELLGSMQFRYYGAAVTQRGGQVVFRMKNNAFNTYIESVGINAQGLQLFPSSTTASGLFGISFGEGLSTTQRTIKPVSSTTGAGADLRLEAGDALSGATDTNAGNLSLSSGDSTGSGNGQVSILATDLSAAGITTRTATIYQLLALGFNNLRRPIKFSANTVTLGANYAGTRSCVEGLYIITGNVGDYSIDLQGLAITNQSTPTFNEGAEIRMLLIPGVTKTVTIRHNSGAAVAADRIRTTTAADLVFTVGKTVRAQFTYLPNSAGTYFWYLTQSSEYV